MDDPAKRIVAVVHRRAGKSTGLMWRGIRRCLTEPKPKPRIVHILPYGVMWKRTGLWDALTSAVRNLPGVDIRKSDMAIGFANGATYQCGGADNQDSWRGGYADECIVDEYDDCPASMVPLVIEPMLADRDGTLVRSGTPKGRGVLQKAYDRARHGADYSTYLLDYTRTGALSQRAIDRLREEMTEEEFAQELECSFEAPNSGSYYGKLMHAAEIAGRITDVPYDPALPVWTSWDLGVHDSTVVWFAQVTWTGEWRFIDYLEDSGAGLSHYTDIIKEKPYRNYAMHLLPHDAAVQELGSGLTRTEVFSDLGLQPWRIVRRHSVADGINAVRMVIPKAYFDAKRCERGINALRHYRREWHEAAQTWRASPVHDWASHCFTGDTKVLTRHGTRRIMDLPQSGEVLTPCGWKPYRHPRITRRNAPLVEVAFADGNMVRCTPDHMFLAESGWTYAKDLHPTSQIRSSLTLSRSFSMAGSIAFGRARDISRSVVSALTDWCGKWLSAKFRAVATFITEMATLKTTPYRTLSACLPASTCLGPYDPLIRPMANSAERQTAPGPSTSLITHESVPQNGTGRRRGVSGTSDMHACRRTSLNPSGWLSRARSAAQSLWPWKETGCIPTNTAPRYARRGLGAIVTVTGDVADVWCITVPDVECFSLANGAVVHNCADSARYMCLGVRELQPPKAETDPGDSWERAWRNQAKADQAAAWRVA